MHIAVATGNQLLEILISAPPPGTAAAPYEQHVYNNRRARVPYDNTRSTAVYKVVL